MKNFFILIFILFFTCYNTFFVLWLTYEEDKTPHFVEAMRIDADKAIDFLDKRGIDVPFYVKIKISYTLSNLQDCLNDDFLKDKDKFCIIPARKIIVKWLKRCKSLHRRNDV